MHSISRTEAAREIREAIEGKAAQREISEPEKKEIRIHVRHEDRKPKDASDDRLLGPAQDADR